MSSSVSEIRPYEWYFKENTMMDLSLKTVFRAMQAMCNEEDTLYSSLEKQLALGVWENDYTHVRGQPMWVIGLMHPHIQKWIEWVAPKNRVTINAWEAKFSFHCQKLVGSLSTSVSHTLLYLKAIDGFQRRSGVYNFDLLNEHKEVTSMQGAVKQGKNAVNLANALNSEFSELKRLMVTGGQKVQQLLEEEEEKVTNAINNSQKGYWWVYTIFGDTQRPLTIALTPGMVLFEGRIGFDIDGTYEGVNCKTIGVGCPPFRRRRMTSTSKSPRICMSFMNNVSEEVDIRASSEDYSQGAIEALLKPIKNRAYEQDFLIVHEIASPNVLAFDMSNARYELSRHQEAMKTTKAPLFSPLDIEQEIVLQPFLNFHVVDDGEKTGLTVLPKLQGHKIVRQIHTHVYTEKECPKCNGLLSANTGTGGQPGDSDEITKARRKLSHLIQQHLKDTDF